MKVCEVCSQPVPVSKKVCEGCEAGVGMEESQAGFTQEDFEREEDF